MRMRERSLRTRARSFRGVHGTILSSSNAAAEPESGHQPPATERSQRQTELLSCLVSYTRVVAGCQLDLDLLTTGRSRLGKFTPHDARR